MRDYPVDIERDDDVVAVTFPDFPEAQTFGDDEADALARAADALETVLWGYIGDHRPIPAPSPAAGRPTVSVSLLGALKMEVYRAMLARDWKKADLARALGVAPTQVDRLLNLDHATPVDHLERALKICGARVRVEAEAIAA